MALHLCVERRGVETKFLRRPLLAPVDTFQRLDDDAFFDVGDELPEGHVVQFCGLGNPKG